MIEQIKKYQYKIPVTPFSKIINYHSHHILLVTDRGREKITPYL
jgi:hypothetical protein